MSRRFLTALTVCVLTLAVSCGQNTDEWVQGTVQSKERTCFTSKDCRFMVYTDVENFEITDQAFGRKNSSDVYGRLQVGKVYRLHVIGYRNPSWTKFRNILEVNEVKVDTSATTTSTVR